MNKWLITLMSGLLLCQSALVVSQNATTPTNDSVATAKTVRIMANDNEGKQVDIEMNVSDGEISEVAQSVLAKLKAKGLLDEATLAQTEEELRLNLDELKKLETLEDMDKNIHISLGGDLNLDEYQDDFAAALLVPIVSVLAVFGAPVLIVWLVTRANTKRRQMLHDSIAQMASEGKDIPPALLNSFERQNTPAGDLHRGIRNALVGAAFIIAFTILAGIEVGAIGLIILATGAAQIISWRIEQKHKSEQP